MTDEEQKPSCLGCGGVLAVASSTPLCRMWGCSQALVKKYEALQAARAEAAVKENDESADLAFLKQRLVLLWLLHCPDPGVREDAVIALAQHPSTEVEVYLNKMKETDECLEVREAAEGILEILW